MARDSDKPKSAAEFNNADESLNEKTLDKVSGGFWGPNANSPRCSKCGLQMPQGWGAQLLSDQHFDHYPELIRLSGHQRIGILSQHETNCT